MASLQPGHTLLAHCDSLDSDSTACTHNVFIGQGCTWWFKTPSPSGPWAPSVWRWWQVGALAGWRVRSSIRGQSRGSEVIQREHIGQESLSVWNVQQQRGVGWEVCLRKVRRELQNRREASLKFQWELRNHFQTLWGQVKADVDLFWVEILKARTDWNDELKLLKLHNEGSLCNLIGCYFLLYWL